MSGANETAAPAKPATGLAALREGWKADLVAGFSVSLIALPLCLGIALASGVPPMAGLIAAIVGGLFVSRITGSFVTISGPAAGLIVVTLGAVESMGAGDAAAGYRFALAAIVVGGLMQLVLGMLRVGKLGDFFPSAAVHGMLAAIGVIIIVKQLFVALGVQAHGHELYEVIAGIPAAVLSANPVVALIAVVSLVILIVHPKIPWKPVKALPAPMWVLVVAIPLGFLFRLSDPHTYTIAGATYELGPELLVQLPENVIDGIVFPDFGMVGTSVFWVAAVSVCLVSSIESLLSAAAVDTLDPFKRKSNLDRDLGVMGAGSSLSAMIGGLPMISEIVRSSANVNSGARTQWANFFHGGFLLLYLLVGAALIEHIPLAALAAMLIHVGYKLTSYDHYKHAWEIGRAQLIIFVVTLVTVLATDLIIGIGAGILTKLLIHLVYGTKPSNIFSAHVEIHDEGTNHIVELTDALVFTNYLSLKKKILDTAVEGHTILDFARVSLVDHTSLDHIQALVQELNDAGRGCEIRNLERLQPVSTHPLATRLAGSVDGTGDRTEEVLDSRQTALRDLTAELRLDYSPARQVAGDGWGRFQLFRGKKVTYEENRISGEVAGAPILVADLSLSAERRRGAATVRLSAVLVGPLPIRVPDFTLAREVMTDKIAARVGFDDIDFPSHQAFSDSYLLRGRDEAAVRELFSSDVIESLTSSNSAVRVESSGGCFLITAGETLTSAADAEALLSFVFGLLPLVVDAAEASRGAA